MANNKNIHVLSRGVVIDQEHLLLCKTLDLPVSFYFLPGGHVEHGESVYDTVLRELKEETGETCQIKRFLGCLEYSFPLGHSSICHNHEYNFIFELQADVLKSTNKIPQLEQHIELVWMPLGELVSIDFRAEPLKQLLPHWLKQQQPSIFNSVMGA